MASPARCGADPFAADDRRDSVGEFSYRIFRRRRSRPHAVIPRNALGRCGGGGRGGLPRLAGSWASAAPPTHSISGSLARHIYIQMSLPQDHAGNDLPIHKRHTCGQRRTQVSPGAAFFTSEAERTAGAAGSAVVGMERGWSRPQGTTGRVGGDPDRAVLRRGPEENASASACVTAAAIFLVELPRGRPGKRTSGLLTPPGFTDRQRTPLYRPAECGTVPAAVLFCCAVSW